LCTVRGGVLFAFRCGGMHGLRGGQLRFILEQRELHPMRRWLLLRSWSRSLRRVRGGRVLCHGGERMQYVRIWHVPTEPRWPGLLPLCPWHLFCRRRHLLHELLVGHVPVEHGRVRLHHLFRRHLLWRGFQRLHDL
jgi:hypothetical protein